MSPKLCLVTGVDAQMFPQLLLLCGSLRRYSPGLKLHVCDFGLTGPQRAFLRRRYVLLDTPPEIVPRHAWDYKAALGRYVAQMQAETVVWLDADMIVLSDIEPPLRLLQEEMAAEGQDVAAADTGLSIDALLAAYPAPHFASLMRGLDRSAPYLNSGFFLCRSRAFLDQWSAQNQAMHYERLYEQNAFNLVALADSEKIRILDRFRWNLVANDLRPLPMTVAGDVVVVTTPTGQPLILHATSNDSARDLAAVTLPLSLSGRKFETRLRMIRHPQDLLAFQQALTQQSIEADHSRLPNWLRRGTLLKALQHGGQ